MLRHLTISNIAVIKDLDITFESGLTVLTGETGAGKSILLDALGLAMGARADTDLIRDDCEKAVIMAEFVIKEPSKDLESILSDQGIYEITSLRLRRLLQQDGRSRAWINDTPVSLGILRLIGPKLMDIVGQYAQMDILDDKEPQEILDSYAKNDVLLQKVTSAFKDYDSCKKRLQEFKNNQLDKAYEKETLQSLVNELEHIDIKVGELTEIEKTRKIMLQGQKISLIANELNGTVNAVSEAYNNLNQVLRLLSKQEENISDYGHKAITTLKTSREEFIEAEALTEIWIESLDFSQQDLAKVEDRFFALKSVCRKHSCDGDELITLLNDSVKQLDELDNSDENVKNLEKKVESFKSIFEENISLLHDARANSARKITAKIQQELPSLKLEKVRFLLEVSLQEQGLWGEYGGDSIKFLFAANPGSTLKSLGKIASGGELTRFLLALKLALANKGNSRSQVFDEIDMAVGGSTAAAIGKRLCLLAKNRQVLVITHSPQVAAFGEKHLKIQKHIVNGKTNTSVIDISSPNYRQEEIARMLAGHDVTDAARKAAHSLLASS